MPLLNHTLECDHVCSPFSSDKQSHVINIRDICCQSQPPRFSLNSQSTSLHCSRTCHEIPGIVCLTIPAVLSVCDIGYNLSELTQRIFFKSFRFVRFSLSMCRVMGSESWTYGAGPSLRFSLLVLTKMRAQPLGTRMPYLLPTNFIWVIGVRIFWGKMTQTYLKIPKDVQKLQNLKMSKVFHNLYTIAEEVPVSGRVSLNTTSLLVLSIWRRKYRHLTMVVISYTGLSLHSFGNWVKQSCNHSLFNQAWEFNP